MLARTVSLQPTSSPAPVNATSSSSPTDPTPPLTMHSLSFVVFLVSISSKQICASRMTFAGSYHVRSNFRTSFRVLADCAVLNSPCFYTATQEYATTKAGMTHNGRTLNGTSLTMAGRASTSRCVLGRLYRVVPPTLTFGASLSSFPSSSVAASWM